MPTAKEAIDRLLKYREAAPSGAWVREKVLARELRLASLAAPGAPQRKLASGMLLGLRHGFAGAKRHKIFAGEVCELGQQPNHLKIRMAKHGARKDFSNGPLSSEPAPRQPRWFLFGQACDRGGKRGKVGVAVITPCRACHRAQEEGGPGTLKRPSQASLALLS